MEEFGFRAGVYRNSPDGPPEFVAAIDISVEAETQEEAEEMATDRLQELVADGYVVEDELQPF